MDHLDQVQMQPFNVKTLIINITNFSFQLYNFGETVSIVLWTDNWKPDSFYDKIASNRKQGLHTLCLLGKCSLWTLTSVYIFSICYSPYIS